MTVRIVTDSACDLPDELLDEYGITVVPLSIRFGSEELIDREQLSVGEFWQRCAASEVLPETAAPAPGQFETAYRRLASEGASAVVVVSLSGALSATIQSAELAARGVADEIDVRIVDSRSVTLGLGTMVLAAARAASTGATADAIVELVGDMSARTKVFGALDTLDTYGAAQALALIPGTSRAGITMTAGLALGLTRQAAARFSFLLSIPVIALAGAHEALAAWSSQAPVAWGAMLAGLLIAFACAYATIHFFLKLVERVGLFPFVVYRLVLGAVLLAFVV